MPPKGIRELISAGKERAPVGIALTNGMPNLALRLAKPAFPQSKFDITPEEMSSLSQIKAEDMLVYEQLCDQLGLTKDK